MQRRAGTAQAEPLLLGITKASLSDRVVYLGRAVPLKTTKVLTEPRCGVTQGRPSCWTKETRDQLWGGMCLAGVDPALARYHGIGIQIEGPRSARSSSPRSRPAALLVACLTASTRPRVRR